MIINEPKGKERARKIFVRANEARDKDLKQSAIQSAEILKVYTV